MNQLVQCESDKFFINPVVKVNVITIVLIEFFYQEAMSIVKAIYGPNTV